MLEWLQNPFVAIGLAIAAMFFGYFFGLFEGRGQGYKRRQAEEAEVAEKNEPEADAELLPPASPALPPGETSVLDVSRDNTGQLRLKLDGQHIHAASMKPEQRKQIIAVLTQIRPLLEPATPAPPPVQTAPARPEPAPEAGPGRSPRPTPPLGKVNEEPVTAPQSIVAQIDTILQAQLVGTPLMGKGIRLQESPEGGVIVWVGISKYEGIDELPDEQINAAIRAAISTWENKYTPGI
jgi:hypothetical protein